MHLILNSVLKMHLVCTLKVILRKYFESAWQINFLRIRIDIDLPYGYVDGLLNETVLSLRWLQWIPPRREKTTTELFWIKSTSMTSELGAEELEHCGCHVGMLPAEAENNYYWMRCNLVNILYEKYKRSFHVDLCISVKGWVKHNFDIKGIV